MRSYRQYIITLLLLLGSMLNAVAQTQNNLIAAKNKIILLIDLGSSKHDIDTILKRAGINDPNAQAIVKGNYSALIKDGWKLVKQQGNVLQFDRKLKDITANPQQSPNAVTENFVKAGPSDNRLSNAVYGVNRFAKPTVYELPSGLTRFVLNGYLSSKRAFLSGSFNDWSTLKGVMTKTSSGWIIDIKLKPGAYMYKFIADGRWLDDPDNLTQLSDGGGNINSVYYKYNYTFKLADYTSAHHVSVAGSFNNQNQDELVLEKHGDVWELPVYLHEGIHTYHFIVDGKWLPDPSNPEKYKEEDGSVSSVLKISQTVYFKLNGYANALTIYLAGNFNHWAPNNVKLKRVGNSWIVQVILASGNYQYKFIVDGQWITDPANPCYAVEDKQVNSFLAVNPTHTFTLKAHGDAKVVHLAGSFNNWNPNEYLMGHTGDVWSINMYLPVGKYLYKYIVDDNWILDPDNKQWQQNQYGTGNSVLWVEP